MIKLVLSGVLIAAALLGCEKQMEISGKYATIIPKDEILPANIVTYDFGREVVIRSVYSEDGEKESEVALKIVLFDNKHEYMILESPHSEKKAILDWWGMDGSLYLCLRLEEKFESAGSKLRRVTPSMGCSENSGAWQEYKKLGDSD